jgi:hypothetical protein
VAAVEGPDKVPRDSAWESEAQGTESTSPTTLQESRCRCGCEWCVGNPYLFFSALVAIGQDAMKDFIKHGVLPCSVFARMNAGERWSGFWKENAGGKSEETSGIIFPGSANGVRTGRKRCLR